MTVIDQSNVKLLVVLQSPQISKQNLGLFSSLHHHGVDWRRQWHVAELMRLTSLCFCEAD